jgi:thiamine biosynthesis lipoprotein
MTRPTPSPAPATPAGPARFAALSRRRLLQLGGAGALVVLTGGTALVTSWRKRRRFQAVRAAMGTTATLVVVHDDPDAAAVAMEEAFGAIGEVERLMTRFRPDSDVGRLNGNPGAWQPVHPATAAVLRAGLEVARASDDRFDPCLERIVAQWGFYDRRYPPGHPALDGLRPRPGEHLFRALEEAPADGGAPRFRLARERVGIDLGGIAKGFAIDRGAARLRELGIRDALINVGDDIFALGGAPEGTPWQVGVRHPRQPGELLEVFSLRNQGIATSGDYENFFERDGRRYSHLVDPETGEPARTHRSVTVSAPTAMLADAMATAAFVAPPAGAKGMLERFAGGPWLAVAARGEVYGG